MSIELVLCRNDVFFDNQKADVIKWGSIYNLLNLNVSLVDRLEYIKFPYNFVNKCPIPELPVMFNKTYQEVCVNRANELYEKSKRLNKRLVVMYSGGIDSTVVLISFLLAGIDTRDVFVCMNTASIRENPRFYYEHIRGNFNLLPSEVSLDMLDGENLMVGGEFNDQTFGSDVQRDFQLELGMEAMHRKINDGDITKFLNSKGISNGDAKFWYDCIINHSKKSNRVDLEHNKDFWWWLNFAFKWQSVYYRLVSRTTKRELITDEFLQDNYNQFFDYADFQIWSMLNNDKKIGATWESYKLTAKQMILDYTKDQEYFDNKLKMGSLSSIFRQRTVPDALAWDNVSNSYVYLDKVTDIANYYNEKNTFNGLYLSSKESINYR
jgi:hypothetical protein